MTASYVPEVKLPEDYIAIAKRSAKDKKEVSVEDKEVQKTVDWIRESRAALVTVNRTAAPGDAVTIDFDTLGETPSLKNTVTLRHRDTGEQERLTVPEVVERIRTAIE